MKIEDLNQILQFIAAEYQVERAIVASGQRMVFLCTKGSASFIMKICPLHPIAVARIQREINILSQIQSDYFPKFHFQYFVTDEVIRYFIDNFDPKTQRERIEYLEALKIKPFLVTVEEHIEHKPWAECLIHLSNQKNLVIFLQHLFCALKMLWDKKIVHRDLKPENILIRPTFVPVVIDLGIAKSMSDGATIITNPAFPSPCTPRFAAPEQLLNNKAEVTYKSDQFSVGVIAFLVLTNRFPYGSDADIGIEGVLQNFLTNNLEKIKAHNGSVIDGLSSLIEKMLMVRPYQRYRNVEDIVTELKKIEELL